MTEAPAAQGQGKRRLAEMKGDLDVRLPVDRELTPALLVQRRGGRKRARAYHEDVGLEGVEYLGRGVFLRSIERQNLDPDLSGKLFEGRPLDARPRARARPCRSRLARSVARRHGSRR